VSYCFSYLLGLATRRTFRLYGESFHHHRLNQLDDNRARSYHYQIYAPPLGCLDPILSWVAIDSSQSMQESPGESTTTQTKHIKHVPDQVYVRWHAKRTSTLGRVRAIGTTNRGSRSPGSRGACQRPSVGLGRQHILARPVALFYVKHINFRHRDVEGRPGHIRRADC
jgi:hypothetical protein